MHTYDVDNEKVLVEFEPEDYEADYFCADVPEGTKVIGGDAFWSFQKLKSVHLPDSVEMIADDAFFDCEKLETINIPNSIKEIGNGAFYHCMSLEKIEVPTDTAVGDAAFSHCYKLADSDGFIIVNNVLYGYSGLTSELVVPQNVRRISGRAFEGRTDIVKVTLPEGLLSIGEDAFYGCANLQEINIPDSTIEIGECAFAQTKIKR